MMRPQYTCGMWYGWCVALSAVCIRFTDGVSPALHYAALRSHLRSALRRHSVPLLTATSAALRRVRRVRRVASSRDSKHRSRCLCARLGWDRYASHAHKAFVLMKSSLLLGLGKNTNHSLLLVTDAMH